MHITETRKVLNVILPIPSEAGLQILNAVIESDLLGLVVRGMTMLKPIDEGISGIEGGKPHIYLRYTNGVLIASIQPETDRSVKELPGSFRLLAL